MAKAVLIMDMPDRCDDCDLWDYDRETDLSYCGSWSGRGRLDDTSSKPDWCPLIPEPERQNTDKDPIQVDGPSYIAGMHDGWNVCLYKLEGKSKGGQK